MFSDAWLHSVSVLQGYYATMDSGYRDKNGYISVLSRSDDVINVAGHRLSAGALEEVSWVCEKKKNLKQSWLPAFWKRSKTHKRLKEGFLIGQTGQNLHIFEVVLFQATYNIKTEKQTINSTYFVFCQPPNI